MLGFFFFQLVGEIYGGMQNKPITEHFNARQNGISLAFDAFVLILCYSKWWMPYKFFFGILIIK